MKKRIALIAGLIAITTLAALPLAAGPFGHGRHGMGHGDGLGILGHLRHMKEELDLTDSQVDQLKAIFSAMHDQNAQYRDQMHDGLKGVAETLLANPNNVAAAQALLDQQAAAERAMKTNLLNATSKALNVLTAEQRTKLSTKLAERHERRGR